MLHYLERHPFASLALSTVGLCLIVAGVILTPNPVSQNIASAADCGNSTYPADVTDSRWSSYWRVTSWLAFADGTRADVPIGPMTWEIKGKSKSEGEVIKCYKENWKVMKAVIASNRRGDRGDIITLNGAGAGIVRKLDASPEANKDGAFTPENAVNSPLGLYGVLNTSANALEQSFGILPTVWLVEGSKYETGS